MSKSQTQRTITMISNLSKDIAGNMLSGNEHRAMLYLKAQRRTLDALLAKLEAGNDVRAEQALDAAIKDINTTLDNDQKGVPFSKAGMDASFEKWEKLGLTMKSFVDSPADTEQAEALAGLASFMEENNLTMTEDGKVSVPKDVYDRFVKDGLL